MLICPTRGPEKSPNFEDTEWEFFSMAIPMSVHLACLK